MEEGNIAFTTALNQINLNAKRIDRISRRIELQLVSELKRIEFSESAIEMY